MPTLLDDLREQIGKGQVVVLVGTGVSIGATLAGDPPQPAPTASWVGLLHHGVERCLEVAKPLPAGWEERVRGEIDSGDMDDLLAAAQKIGAKLGAPDGEYARWLRETVGQLRVVQPEVLEALRDLALPLATTNYDGLIEEVTGLRPVTWKDGRRVERVLRGEEVAVLHLHGYWDEPDSVIFDLRSYLAVLGDGHAQAMLRAMRTARTLLFVGFGAGLSDPNFGALLKWAREIFSGSEYRHFRLCRTSELDQLRAAHPAEDRIFPLAFGDGHRDLAPFLRSLVPSRTPATPAAAPIPPPPSSAASRLPKPPRSFTGRDALVERLVGAILEPDAAPVPVLGAAGIGKSALTLAALHEPRVAARFGDRRYFVRCDGAQTRPALVSELARVLALPAGGNPEDVLLVELGRAPALLVLDNTETPLNGDQAAVEELLKELGELPGVVLVASIRGEQRPAGGWAEAVRVRRLDVEHSRKVFLAAAGAEHRYDPHLDQLVRAVDGVPLALELLGRQADGEPDLAGLWQRWQTEKTRLLRHGAGKKRLTDVEYSLELSICSPRVQGSPAALRLLKLLARLPDGAAHRDLEALLPGEALSAAATLRAAALANSEGDRLRMLAPIREYVQRDHAPEVGELARAARFYVELFKSEGRRVGREGGDAAVQRLAPEVANLEALADHVLNQEDEQGIRTITHGYTDFARFSGYGSPQLLLRIEAACRARLQPTALAECILSLGRLAMNRSDHFTAQERYDEALPLFQQSNDHLGQANCIKDLGDIALRRSEYDLAGERYGEALPRFRHVGDLLGQADCVQRLGHIALRRSEYDKAGELYAEALSLFRKVGNLLGQANCNKGLGDIALRRSEYDKARERYGNALPLFQQAGNPLGQANCIQGLGDIALAFSDHDLAGDHYEKALPLYRHVGSLLGQANCIHSLGDIALDNSEYEKAEERYSDALELYRNVGSVLGQANCIQGLGCVAEGKEVLSQAISLFQEALRLFVLVGDPDSIGGAHDRLARVVPDPVERRAHVEAARAAWRGIGREDLIEEFLAEFEETE